MMVTERNTTAKIHATVPQRQYTVLPEENQNLKC